MTLLRTAAVAATLLAAGGVAATLSPWPSALAIRWAFDLEARRLSHALEAHVPAGVAEQLNLRYDPSDSHAYLDVFYAAGIEDTNATLPTIVWIHGGAWLSGSKDYIANYARILAGNGYTVATVRYSLAPAATYPTPLRQISAGLRHLTAHACELHVDAANIFLAGSSAGAQIAAQLANAIGDPAYAARVPIEPPIARTQLAGAILYSGAYELSLVDLTGPYAFIVRTALWSYSGTRDFANDPQLDPASVARHLSPRFPATFISAGNADPLLEQSRAFSDALTRAGVAVDALFFRADHEPKLPHEYQFDLETAAGQAALARSVEFLAEAAGPASRRECFRASTSSRASAQ